MKLLKLENLVIAFYVLIIGATFVLLDQLRVPEKRGMPIMLGVLSMAFYVLSFRVWYRMAPSSSRVFLAIHAVAIPLFFVPGLAAAGLILPVPLLFAAIYCAQRECGKAFTEWLTANGFTHMPQVSAVLLEKLGPANHWYCFANSFSLGDGRKIPFVFWQGETGGMTNIGGRPTKVRHPIIAFSFSQHDVGEGFMAKLETMKQDKLNWFQRLKPWNQARCPYAAERLSDGSFAVAWGNPHLAGVVQERMEMLRRLAESSPDKAAPPGSATASPSLPR